MKSFSILNTLKFSLLILITSLPVFLFAQVPIGAGDSSSVQNAGSQITPSSVLPVATPVDTDDSVSHILSVKVLRGDVHQDKGLETSVSAYANDIISIKINNARQFFLLRPTDFSKLVLYANGIQLNGMVSDRFSLLSRQDVLSGRIQLPDTLEIPFQLLRDSTTQTAWRNLYILAEHWYSHKLTFHADLGWDGMFPLSYSTNHKDLEHTEVTVVFYNRLVYWIWVLSYVGFIGLFIFLCANTNLIREGTGVNGAYSLSQTQLVFWTVLIIGGFIYSVVLTDLTSSLNPSVLLLLGVSIGTTGLASSINYYKKEKGAASNKKHKNFLYDILSDGETLSVHRTQIMLWNVVFGIYLVFYTITNKTMPEISATMLVLSGVSSSFYLGSKIIENGSDPGYSDSGAGAPFAPNNPAVNGPDVSVAAPNVLNQSQINPITVTNPDSVVTVNPVAMSNTPAADPGSTPPTSS